MKFKNILFYSIITILYFCTTANSGVMNRINIQGGISLYPDPRTGPDVYVEFPFAVHRSQFTFLPGNNPEEGLIGGIYAEIILNDTLSNPIDSSRITFYFKAADSLDAQDENMRLFNRLSLMVPPGTYKAKLTVLDIVGKGEGSFLYDLLEIDPIVDDRLNLSSLELAYRILAVEDSMAQHNDRLIKNNREVIPNPMGVFSENDTCIYVYTELYNIAFTGAVNDTRRINDTFSLNYNVYESDGSPYYDYGDIHQTKPGSTAVLTNILNISDFKPGHYNLSLIVKDFSSGMSDTTSKRFIIFPKSGEIEFAVTSIISHPYDTASLETKLNLAKFLMAPQQLAMLKTLNDLGKERFVDQFFSDHDPDLTTEENEYLDDIFNRYVFANEKFSTMSDLNDGWRSDRGRVLLQYNAWDEREEAMAPSVGKPWELWSYYSVQGGVVFVFQDIDGYGDFKLVHSNARGEIFNDEWDNFIKKYDPKIYKEGLILPGLKKD